MPDSLRAGMAGRRRHPGQWLDVDAWEDDDSPVLSPIRRKRMPADAEIRKRRRDRSRVNRDFPPLD